jgi:hypothetical protein
MKRAITVLTLAAALALTPVASGSHGYREVQEQLQHPKLSTYQSLNRKFRKAVHYSGALWGVEVGWLYSCARSEGWDGGKQFSWDNNWAGAAGPWQYLSGTFDWMSNEAWKAAKKEHRVRLPMYLKKRDKIFGQAFTTGWAFSHGYSYHWYGAGC